MAQINISNEELQERLSKVKSIDDLVGKNGLLTDIFKNTVQEMMESELTNQLGYPKGIRELKQTKNKRNGHSKKTLRTSMGETEIEVPRDREGEFEPKILGRYEKTTSELEDKIISMYGKGVTVSDINDHLASMYGISVTDSMISQMTNKILPLISEWQNRSLEEIYVITYLDAIHFKIRDDGKVKTKAAYIIYGIDCNGQKDILGIWIGEEEGASFWLKVLTDIQKRGVQDLLMVCCDNLKGLSEAIQTTYPEAIIQKCVIHQIRNSLKYICSKDQKEFLMDLKKVYQAVNKDEAETNLLGLDEKWGHQYGIVIKSWQNNWEELSQYFRFSHDIRKLIYTTNRIEGFNRQIRKVTKNKAVFPSDNSLMKMLYLATQDILKKWTQPVHNWGKVIAQLNIHFPERIKLDL